MTAGAPRGSADGAAGYWSATAKPAPDLAPLAADRHCDVAVVGGGLAGLSAAHHLAASGLDAVVLEARDIGWGASGRNAGFAVFRYKRGFAALAARYGDEATRRLHGLLVESLAILDEFSDTHGLAGAVRQCGHLTAAHGPAALGGLEADLGWLSRVAGDAVPRLLSKAETRAGIGNGLYAGGLLDPRGKVLHPLDYVRGLAGSLAGRGIAIHPRTPVTALGEHAGGVALDTPGGRVTAGRAIFATNAYTDLVMKPGDLHRRVVPVSSSLVVTAPLPDSLRAAVVPGGAAVSNTRRLMNAFRMLPDGRLLFAGRADLTGRRADDPRAYRLLERELAANFPALADVPVEYRWSGMVAVSMDDLPHVGRLSERVLFVLGCGGRGVLLSHGLGRLAAQMAAGEPVADSPVTAPMRPVPFHGLRVPAMQVMAGYYGLRDRFDAMKAG